MSSGPIALHVERWGQAGWPVLCLHGHPGSGASMAVFGAHLGSQTRWNFRAIAPDLRGYGASRSPGEFAMLDHLGDLEALLDREGIERCVVIGWSLGGILALELALRQGDRIAGLVLIASAARPVGNHPPITWRDEVYTAIAALINLVVPGWQWNIDTFGQRSLLRYLVSRATPATYRYLARFAVPAFLGTSRAATRALNAALRQRYNRLEAIAAIACPTLVLAGSDDRHITAAASAETAAALPNAQFHCFPNTAHLFPWEVPDEMLAVIDQWLGQWLSQWLD